MITEGDTFKASRGLGQLPASVISAATPEALPVFSIPKMIVVGVTSGVLVWLITRWLEGAGDEQGR